jgi:DNA polymerase-1
VALKKDMLPIYRTYEDFDYENLLFYAGLDTIATSTVLSRIFPHLVDEPIHYIVGPKGEKVKTHAKSIIQTNEDITKLAHEFIIDLEINGLKYDREKNAEIGNRMIAEIKDLDDKLKDKIPSTLNLDSGTEVAKFLYGDMGFEPPFLTATGEPSTDGNALLTLAGLNPLKPGKYITPDPELQYLAYMAKRKDISSTYNTFIKTYAKDFVAKDGRIHPSYLLHGTSGFRISGIEPNLTQLPRPKHGYNIRTCYTVEDGMCFISFDFSSAEVKILAALCKDANMLKAVREKLDFHSMSASLMAGCPYEDFVKIIEDHDHPKYKEYKEMRQVAKVLTFSILYGSSAGGIAFQLNISKEEAQKYMDMFFMAYPGMKTFIDNAHQEALWNQRVITPFGQRRQEYGTYQCFKPTAAYNAALRNSANVLVQSTTSTLGLIVFSHLNEAIKKIGGKSICTVYDSIELEVPIGRAAEAIELAFHHMNDLPKELHRYRM